MSPHRKKRKAFKSSFTISMECKSYTISCTPLSALRLMQLPGYYACLLKKSTKLKSFENLIHFLEVFKGIFDLKKPQDNFLFFTISLLI